MSKSYSIVTPLLESILIIPDIRFLEIEWQVVDLEKGMIGRLE
jgi:hypothetical protein